MDGPQRSRPATTRRGVSGTATSVRIGMVEAALTAMLFGTAYVGTALALRSFTPVTVAAWRSGIGGIGLAVVVIVLERRWGLPDRRRAARFVLLGLLNGPVFLLAMNVAVSESGPTIAAFVTGLYAIFGALLAPLVLKERLGVRAVVGFAVALVGSALLAELQANEHTLVGVAVGFIAAIAFGFYLVLSRRWSRGEDAVAGAPVALTISLATTVVLFPIAFVTQPSAIVPANPDTVALLALLWLAIGPSFLAQLLLLDSVRRVPARASSAFLLINPPTAAVVAFVVLGEQLAPIQLVGAVLVLAGIAAATFPMPERWQRSPVRAG